MAKINTRILGSNNVRKSMIASAVKTITVRGRHIMETISSIDAIKISLVHAFA